MERLWPDHRRIAELGQPACASRRSLRRLTPSTIGASPVTDESCPSISELCKLAKQMSHDTRKKEVTACSRVALKARAPPSRSSLWSCPSFTVTNPLQFSNNAPDLLSEMLTRANSSTGHTSTTRRSRDSSMRQPAGKCKQEGATLLAGAAYYHGSSRHAAHPLQQKPAERVEPPARRLGDQGWVQR